MRMSARLHWWYVSLNAWGLGLWLIIGRQHVRPVAVVAVALVYVVLAAALVLLDLMRGHAAVTQSDPRRVQGEYHRLDERLGWAPQPGARARVTRTEVYDVEYRIDHRGRRRTVPDLEADRRLFVLGDSFAFGWGVNDEETFSSRLAEALGSRARVVNAGVEGYGLTQIYGRFLDLRDDVQAGDLVVLTLIGDDIARNWLDFVFVSRMLFGPKRVERYPVFHDGHLRIHDTTSRAKQLKAVLVHAPWLGSVVRALLLPPPEKAMDGARQMVGAIQRDVQARGARFLVVQLPTGGELRGRHPQLDLSGLGAMQIGSRFPRDRAGLAEVFLSDDDGHYSSAGHRLVAEALVDELARRGWVPRSQ
jgi:lysophospholipase L1-like esterase